jgi:hypothetical protein
MHFQLLQNQEHTFEPQRHPARHSRNQKRLLKTLPPEVK